MSLSLFSEWGVKDTGNYLVNCRTYKLCGEQRNLEKLVEFTTFGLGLKPWDKVSPVEQPEQNAVLQHAPLATLIKKSAFLDVSGLARVLLPRRQRNLNQVPPGVVWRVATVTTR